MLGSLQRFAFGCTPSKIYFDGNGDGAVKRHEYKCKNRVSIAHWIGNYHQPGVKLGFVVKVTHYTVTYVCEEPMLLTEPIIEDAWNESVGHVRPYIGEVVGCFSPPLRVHPVGETVRERDNYSSDDNRSLFSSSDDDGSMRNFKQDRKGMAPELFV
jgi:hypothetical protein